MKTDFAIAPKNNKIISMMIQGSFQQGVVQNP